TFWSVCLRTIKVPTSLLPTSAAPPRSKRCHKIATHYRTASRPGDARRSFLMSERPDSSESVADPGIRFVLDGKIVQARDLSPQTTLLEFLREHLGRVGTKEGCAEGDC